MDSIKNAQHRILSGGSLVLGGGSPHLGRGSRISSGGSQFRDARDPAEVKNHCCTVPKEDHKRERLW